MSDTVIQVKNLSKKYVIQHQQQERYTTLRDVFAKQVRNVLSPLQGSPSKVSSSSQEEFWALKDVSFEIKQGDRVGIIGRNGAGKSTLLKILSRITEPTAGRIQVKGRIASLLEVGTGFHPELTGRENIFLNGAILGMSKAEIQRKFDEIVAFAEIEKFLDTPVKRYSSGMYVRLAFAVAAHLEPEILVVDEVLAVGDAQFQEKCLGKMKDVGREGRTVLFVSHNMGAIATLCNQGIFLKTGQVQYVGSIDEVIEHYSLVFRENTHLEPGIIFQKTSQEKNHHFQILKIALLDRDERLKPIIKTWDFLKIRIYFYSPKTVTCASVEFSISTYSGNKLIQYSTNPLSGIELSFTEGEMYIDCVIPYLPLAAGRYQFSVGLAIPKVEWLCWEESIASLEVYETDVYNSHCPPTQQRTPIVVEHYWELPKRNEPNQDSLCIAQH